MNGSSERRGEPATERRAFVVGDAIDGQPVRMPLGRVLSGHGFVAGESGSGKSNTASVVAEELLEAGYPLLVVDVDGEYYGLKEEYELLHVGADEECDVQVGPEHAERMVTLALERRLPVVLDVSGYLDEDVVDDLLYETLRELLDSGRASGTPLLVIVEEIHEFLPADDDVGETGDLLLELASRGRESGLGLLGVSRRPATVETDVLAGANWLVWHRLARDDDADVAGRTLPRSYVDDAVDLDDGQAFLQRDWTDVAVRTVQFRRKRTFDAGATPGLDDADRPTLEPVSDDAVESLRSVDGRARRGSDRVAELERRLQRRDERIAELEAELAVARDTSAAAERIAEALDGGSDERHDESVDDPQRRERRIVELECENERLREALRDLRLRLDRIADGPVGTETSRSVDRADGRSFAYVDHGVTPTAPVRRPASSGRGEMVDVLDEPELEERFYDACADSQCSEAVARRVVDELLRTGPADAASIAARVDRSTVAVQSLLSELATREILTRSANGSYGPSKRLAALATAGRAR